MQEKNGAWYSVWELHHLPLTLIPHPSFCSLPMFLTMQNKRQQSRACGWEGRVNCPSACRQNEYIMSAFCLPQAY